MSELQVNAIVLERYRLEEHLQGREHTQTWKAMELNSQREVVVKVLDMGQGADWQAYTLFEREAQALQSLNHPRIPRFLAFENQGQQVILVQEAIRGESLRARMRSGWKLTEPQARQLALDILELLEQLHAQDPPLVHRDIKPENLILNDRNEVFLIDFGAVRQLTQHNYTVAGSFSYMAPEQLQGKAIPASDLYGLGMTLIELLSGSPLEALPREGLYLKFQETLHVSAGFERWLEHVVAPYPVQRFASARAAIEALNAPEHLAELEQRGRLAPGHGKQALTPHIWLKQDEDLELEFKGQVMRSKNGRYIGASVLACIAAWILPITAFFVNEFYRFVRIPGPRGIEIVVLMGLGLLSYVLTFYLMKKLIPNYSLYHQLTALEEYVIYRSTRSGRWRKQKVKYFPRLGLEKIILSPYHITLVRKRRWFKKYRFTLLVPFAPEIRERVALAFAQKGIETDVR